MKQTIAILRSRWPEVAVLLAVWTGSAILGSSSHPSGSAEWAKSGILHCLSYLGLPLTLLGWILEPGFVRLVCLRGQARQPFAEMWRTGLPFFWRMFGFGLLLILPAIFVLFFITRAAGYLSHTAPPNLKDVMAPFVGGWFVLLIKPAVYMPALIINKDCGIYDAWKRMRSYPILRELRLPVLFLLSWLIPSCPKFLTGTMPELLYVATVTAQVASAFIWLVVLLEAVRVVGPPEERIVTSNPIADPTQTPQPPPLPAAHRKHRKRR
ncbi:MAG: hypothetical protein HZA91_20570 [Verrucomicrobia bacterium]|nr:hypothetical protein [Verrucomicrobiota bacterium]